MMGLPGKTPDYLPESIKELIDVIGTKATEVIINERGGITLCVPANVSKDHWLFHAIGERSFTALVERYQREELLIPLCAKAFRKMKETQIIEGKEQGLSTFQLARQHGCTDRNIRLILERNRNQEPDPQTDLFNQE